MSTLTTISLPIPWDAFGLPNPLQTRSTCLVDGNPGWAWDLYPPDLPIATVTAGRGKAAPGWDLDHIVMLAPDLEAVITTLSAMDLVPRLRLEVKGRPTAFYRVGPILEIIESPVRAPSLYGVALVTEHPLEMVVLRWRSRGLDVTDPMPAIQPGRKIFTVKGTDAGLAVMSPDRNVA